MKRSAGILMPIFSLPSNYGIGTLGKQAYKFVDFLKASKQTYWQILPIGPISYGDSPYSSFSTYAGNPYYIDLDILIDEGLLNKEDVKDLKNDIDYIDYEYLYNTRYVILQKAFKKGFDENNKDYIDFINDNAWLDDYALYMAVKKHFDMKSWIDWPDDSIKLRNLEGINKYTELLQDDINFYKYIQYLFFKQFNALKKYINDLDIKLIGDIPIYVPLDSSDCWANPECFDLDENYVPKLVSGVPPDYFSEDGQLWGNPVYNWDYMKSNDYKWWIDRIGGASKIYDVIRIDHFRGFESYWAVPYGEKTAKNGKWIKGPDMDLLDKLKGWFSNVEFIAEDLGYHTEAVQKMLDNFGFPGMKVLQFSFDSRDSGSSPHTFSKNSICYVGTHDNSTANGFETAADRKDVEFCKEYLGINVLDEFNWSLIKAGMATVCDVFITQMQDYLDLDDDARINTPGTLGNNWKWRMDLDDIDNKLIERIARITKIYGRVIENDDTQVK